MSLRPLRRTFVIAVALSLGGACGHADDRSHSHDDDEDSGAGNEDAHSSKHQDAGSTKPNDAGPVASPSRDAATSHQPTVVHGGDPGHVIAEPEDDATYVFAEDTLRTYNIVIEAADLATIDADPAAEAYVNAKLEVDGETYGPLGVRYKGSVGSFYTPCTAATPNAPLPPGQSRGPKVGKCSMKIDFDHVDSKLRFHGLKKLNFHSMGRDTSMMRERLGYAMFREFGIAAPRAMHMRLLINGKLEGVYIAVEQLDGRFTRSRFDDGGDGNLYKEVWPVSEMPADYRAALETNEGDDTSVEKMIGFKHAVDLGAKASFKWLDADYTFKYLAADRMVINDDGPLHWYCSYNHNYYWYEAEHADRMWLIPWDLDGAFEGGSARVHLVRQWNTAADCACGIDGQLPSICDPLTAEWAGRDEDYQRALDDFTAGPFSERNVNTKLATWSEQIDAAAQEAGGLHGAPSYEEWQTAFATLRAVVESSREHRGYPYDVPPDGSGEPDPDSDAGGSATQ
jgi:spore coat protein CotH